MVKEEHWVIRSPLGSCVASRRASTTGAETGHIASNDKMRTTVGALCIGQEPKETECNGKRLHTRGPSR